jgi:hypothetical protein
MAREEMVEKFVASATELEIFPILLSKTKEIGNAAVREGRASSNSSYAGASPQPPQQLLPLPGQHLLCGTMHLDLSAIHHQNIRACLKDLG